MKYIINNNNVIKLRQTYRKVLCFIYFPFLPFLYFVSVLLVFLYFFCISFFLQHLVFMKMLYFGNGKGLARQIIHFVFFLILFLVFAFVSGRDKLGNFILMLSQIYWEREIHVKKSFLPTDLQNTLFQMYFKKFQEKPENISNARLSQTQFLKNVQLGYLFYYQFLFTLRMYLN